MTDEINQARTEANREAFRRIRTGRDDPEAEGRCDKCGRVSTLHDSCEPCPFCDVERLQEHETWLKRGHDAADGFLDVPSKSHIVDKVCIIGWARDELREEVERLREEVARLQQVANNSMQCSQCLSRSPPEPVCMYCAECYGRQATEVERLQAELAPYRAAEARPDDGDMNAIYTRCEAHEPLSIAKQVELWLSNMAYASSAEEDADKIERLQAIVDDFPKLTRPEPGVVNPANYRAAMSGEGPLAATWIDKPHRLVYDLCGEVRRLQAIVKQLPVCGRLVGSGDTRRLVQDVPVTPGRDIWSVGNWGPIQWWVNSVENNGRLAGTFHGDPINMVAVLCYDSREAAEAAKGK